MNTITKKSEGEFAATQCYQDLSEVAPRFWGREDALKAIQDVLMFDDDWSKLERVFALYGMGGVGKTQIASQFGNRNRNYYKNILWIAADSISHIARSFRLAAKWLGLVRSEREMQNTKDVVLKVHR